MSSSLIRDVLKRIYDTVIFNHKIRYSDYFGWGVYLFNHFPCEGMLKKAVEFIWISNVEGDYLEFGVWEGFNFVSAYHLAKKKCKTMNYFAFDSFRGLPKPEDIDGDSNQFQEGQYFCSVDKFKKTLKKRGVDLNKVKVVEGLFEDTLNEKTKKKLKLKSAAIVWVDCDLYKSTVPVLNFITDIIVDGSIIIFDDWFCFKGDPERGEQKAFSEWLARNPNIKAIEYHRFGLFGNSFIIKKLKTGRQVG